MQGIILHWSIFVVKTLFSLLWLAFDKRAELDLR